MLQRAANNAYSWWWASHIRTKQSKWLEENLQDMEENVNNTLKILDDDGDTFAQRAEMYYRKRPELINFVEESFQAYRALAERYDRLSKELQRANCTIATVFPDQVQYQTDKDEEEGGPGTSSSSSDPNKHPQDPSVIPIPSIPTVPKIEMEDFRSTSMSISRKGSLKTTASTAKFVVTPSSGLSKTEALQEIGKLQKEILALQTEKEFVKSVYERAYEKFWEIEDHITGMQNTVSGLQDEFGIGTIIEDNEARTLMASTALKSCQETLAKLQEIQDQSSFEAKIEYQRIKAAHDKFETLRDEFISKHKNQQEPDDGNKSESTGQEPKILDQEVVSMEQEGHELESLRERIKVQLENSDSSLTVTELAERIDELVNKVVALETASFSQTALVKTLKSETDELQTQLQSLEEDKEMLIEGSDNTSNKLNKLEEELRRLNNLNQSFKHQSSSLKTHFTEANCNLEHLSGILQDVKPDEEAEDTVLFEEKRNAPHGKPEKESEEHGDRLAIDDDSAILKDVMTAKEAKEDDVENTNYSVRNEEESKSSLSKNLNFLPDKLQEPVHEDNDYKEDMSETLSNLDTESQELGTGSEEYQPNWRNILVNGSDHKEQTLFEYASVLPNYKDVRTKLNSENKNRDSIFELAIQIRELKNAISSRDKEIQFLYQKLSSPEANPDESPYTTVTEYKYTPKEGLLKSRAQAANLQDSRSSYPSPYAKSPISFGEQNDKSTEKHDVSTGNLKNTHTKEEPREIKVNPVNKARALSTIERKFRSDIDDLLEENLEFWLRFSSAVHQIQKFQTSTQDLNAELLKIKDKMKKDGNSKQQSLKSEVWPIYRHLREIQKELSLWLEHNAVLQNELHGRSSSLANILDEISRVSHEGPKGQKAELGGYQAAKFQGDVLNMKQENNKVADELHAGHSCVKGLKIGVERTLAHLDEEFGMNNNSHMKQSTSRSRIPLRSFLFGVKLKKQKQQNNLLMCESITQETIQ
ncbi:Protein NETWORKED 2A [Quillaja saponaria]|uniref:Protein NETWORKED 2A n=1 Tax=Quillaja saponaria TaxID=32244 RepID=A0AAD7PT21_QUISA|nr:Protein NETWORKED 2A [Quillaja saponaria]